MSAKAILIICSLGLLIQKNSCQNIGVRPYGIEEYALAGNAYGPYGAAPRAYEAAPIAYGAQQIAYEAAPIAYAAPSIAYGAAPIAYEAAPLNIAGAEYAYAANGLAYEAPIAIRTEDYGCAVNAYETIPLAGAAPLAYQAGPVVSNPYGFAPSSGGAFLINSMSPIAPAGIRVVSENAIEGLLAVSGDLPFLSAIAIDGVLPTSGAGGINYGCGGGAVGIVSENIAPIDIPYAGAGYNGVGYGSAAAGVPAGSYGRIGYGGYRGCGCGGML